MNGTSSQFAKILTVATAVPQTAYTQQDLIKRMQIDDPLIVRLFASTQIKQRYLILPEGDELNESQEKLIKKHLQGALQIGREAIEKALANCNLNPTDIDFLCVVTSTGFLLPGLTAHLIKAMGLRLNCQRVDIVGMGCNAGLNGLNTVRNWSQANPNKIALLLCVEICSAIYVNNKSLRSHVVNSLFGDGAGALIITTNNERTVKSPQIIDFYSHIIPDAIDAMHYDWDAEANKFSFYLHHNNPYVVGKFIKEPVQELLNKHNIPQPDIAHWIIHGGGRNVISAVKLNLGISTHDMRHTISVLRDYGNVSSGSFLFSYERLLKENIVQDNDYGICITIGPGAQLETALLKW